MCACLLNNLKIIYLSNTLKREVKHRKEMGEREKERERQRESETERQTDRKRERNRQIDGKENREKESCTKIIAYQYTIINAIIRP